MNPFVLGLGLTLFVGWVAFIGVAFFGGMVMWRDEDGFIRALGAGAVLGGVAMVLLTLAVVTGGLNFGAGRPDGCYLAHTHFVGKTFIQSYDPIACPS